MVIVQTDTCQYGVCIVIYLPVLEQYKGTCTSQCGKNRQILARVVLVLTGTLFCGAGKHFPVQYQTISTIGNSNDRHFVVS